MRWIGGRWIEVRDAVDWSVACRGGGVGHRTEESAAEGGGVGHRTEESAARGGPRRSRSQNRRIRSKRPGEGRGHYDPSALTRIRVEAGGRKKTTLNASVALSVGHWGCPLRPTRGDRSTEVGKKSKLS